MNSVDISTISASNPLIVPLPKHFRGLIQCLDRGRNKIIAPKRWTAGLLRMSKSLANIFVDLIASHIEVNCHIHKTGRLLTQSADFADSYLLKLC